MRPVVVEFVASDEIEKIQWNDKKSGELKSVTKQKAYLHGGGAYPVPFKVTVDDKKGPHRPGFYLLAGDAFKLGDFDRLEFLDRSVAFLPLAEAITALGEIAKGAKS